LVKIIAGQDDFEKFVNELQKEIDEKALEEFSPRVLELFKNPQNWGAIKNPTVEGELLGPCGDTVKYFIKINSKTEVIEDITFITDGCGPSIASASQTTMLVKNKSVADALKLEPEDVAMQLGKLPPEHAHCPLLAINSLKEVLNKYLKTKK